VNRSLSLPLPFAIGALLGVALFQERRARRAAERFGGAALETLLKAIDANDPQTGSHVRRVAAYALVLAEALGLDEEERHLVERVALFHDIGKIHEALFDIVHDDSRLTREERRAIATHPRRGAEVLDPLRAFYPQLAEGVLSHHECWDGSGYPRCLRGERIPLCARVVALADTFDAITHSRRYRSAPGVTVALDAIRKGRGTQFDPSLVDLMLRDDVLRRILHTHEDLRRRPAVGPERRRGERERMAPDVTFRWRLRPERAGAAPRADGSPAAR
jgi:putative nucleotidyltransferase with HDIG domain